MNFDPEQSLARLRTCRRAFEQAPVHRQPEAAQTLARIVNTCELELSNLPKSQHGSELHRRLIFELEMGRGLLKASETAARG